MARKRAAAKSEQVEEPPVFTGDPVVGRSPEAQAEFEAEQQTARDAEQAEREAALAQGMAGAGETGPLG